MVGGDCVCIMLVAGVFVLAVALALVSRLKVAAEFKARHGVETIVSGILIFLFGCGRVHDRWNHCISWRWKPQTSLRWCRCTDFLFGLNWEPQIPIREDQVAAEGAFGWLPVILGTIVITVVATTIAVPVGLMSAIYYE